jgi:hypothetical protein
LEILPFVDFAGRRHKKKGFPQEALRMYRIVFSGAYLIRQKDQELVIFYLEEALGGGAFFEACGGLDGEGALGQAG